MSFMVHGPGAGEVKLHDTRHTVSIIRPPPAAPPTDALVAHTHALLDRLQTQVQTTQQQACDRPSTSLV